MKVFLTVLNQHRTPPPHLRQIGDNDPLYVLAQVLPEQLRQPQHGLTRRQLGALHQTLLIKHKQIATAGEHGAATLLARHFRRKRGCRAALFPRVDDEAFDELAEVPVLRLDVDGEEGFEALADNAFN